MGKICNIYKSSKEKEMYLYVEKKDDFSIIPGELLKRFGEPIFVMKIAISEDMKLARVDPNDVLKMIKEKNFFLQMPPIENFELTSLHRKNSKF